MKNFAMFSELSKSDPEIYQSIENELKRQQNQLEMIASENFTSLSVMAATGSVMTNKYAEGYAGRRYYSGCEFVDVAEKLAIERVCKIFGCNYANVQPHSGAQANQAVYLGLLHPGDTLMGMALDSGGHLTHGSNVNMSGKWFHAVTYQTDKNGWIDMDEVENIARLNNPKIIIAGGSAYPRILDFARFREIANSVGAYLMVDMAHFAGLVAGGAFPSPFEYAHVVTSTTHKTIRGPRGGMILWNDEGLTRKFNSAVFPGNQGGPLMHVIAAKAVAFGEILKPEFKTYAQQIVKNCKALGKGLADNDIDLVSGGTDCHLLLVNLSKFNISGKQIADSLERSGITCNKNGIPHDHRPPTETSGVRLGTPAGTTRGLKEEHFEQVGKWIAEVIKSNVEGDSDKIEKLVKSKIVSLCKDFPLYAALN